MTVVTTVKFILLVAFLWNSFASQNYSHHGLFWGSTPKLTASLISSGTWQTIENASVTVKIIDDKSALISYDLTVEGFRNINNSPLPRESNVDTLQVRCTVDGIPYRYSSAYASTYLVEQRIFSKLSSAFVANLTVGSHNVTMQWKKSGTSINQWMVSNQGAGGGVGSGFALSVLADAEQINHLHEMNDVYLYSSDAWKPLSKNLTFFLSTAMSVTIGYAFTAQPQLASFIKDRNYEYVTARISVDGVAFAEGSETRGSTSWNPSALTLKGTITMTLPAGHHTVNVQWRKAGSVFKSWGSSPSYLDGFASSRNLFVLVDKISSPQFVDHDRQVFHGSALAAGQWQTVGNKVEYITLVKESAVLITYALPVTQHENPNLDSNVWDPLARIDARLLVDNLPYTFTGGSSVVAGSRTMDSLFSSLPLVLPAGTHSIALQWRADGKFNWTTLNDIADGFSHGEKLLTHISSENARPTVSAPASVTGFEDVVLPIFGVSVGDVDVLLQPGMVVQVTLTTVTGTLSFPNEVLLGEFPVQFIYGTNYSTAILTDTISNVNTALSRIEYLSPPLWFGEDLLEVQVSDRDNVGYGAEPLTSSATVRVVIQSVDNPFSLSAPTTQSFNASACEESLVFADIVLFDVDSYLSVFRVQLAVSCGSISIPHPQPPLTFLMGDGVQDFAMDYQGVYADVVASLQGITFLPDVSCNRFSDDDFLSVRVVNTENLLHNVTAVVLLQIERANSGPQIVADKVPRWTLSGLVVDPTLDLQTMEVNYTQLPVGIRDTLLLGSAAESGGGALLLENKERESSMSELSLLQGDFFTYVVAVQSEVIPMALVSSSYIQRNVPKMVALTLDEALINASHSFVCLVGSVRFEAVVLSPSSVTCNITVAADDADVIKHRSVWLQLAFADSNNEVKTTSFVPLFLSQALEILAVSPSAVFVAGRSVLRLECTAPAVVDLCIIGEVEVSAAVGDGVVSCRVPNLADSSSSLSVRLASKDRHFQSLSVTLTVMPAPVLSSAYFVGADNDASTFLSAQLVAVVDWGPIDIEALTDANCVVQNVTVAAAYVTSSNVHCFLDSREVSTVLARSVGTEQAEFWVQTGDQRSNIQSVSTLNLTVVASQEPIAAQISAVNSLTPLATGSIVLYGNALLSAPQALECRFSFRGNQKVVGDSVAVTDSRLTCMVPAVLGGQDPVMLTVLNGEEVVFSAVIRVSALPTVLGLWPDSGAVGTVVEVKGLGFSTERRFACLFGSVQVAAAYLSPTTLSCTVPPLAEAAVEMRVLVDDLYASQAGNISFHYQQSSLVVLGISPSSGGRGGGTDIAVTGRGFLSATSTSDTTMQALCVFGSEVSLAVVVSDEVMQCTSPPQGSNIVESRPFSVVLSGGDRSSGSVFFRFVDPVAVTSCTPSHGAVGGGTVVVVRGTGFVSSDDLACMFGDVSVPARLVNSTLVECESPPAEEGTVSLSLKMRSHELPVADDSSFVAFTYWRPILLASVEPAAGPAYGGNVVTLRGSEFRFDDDLLCVFGSQFTPAQFVTTTEVQCVAPSSARTGVVQVSLVSSNGVETTLNNATTYRYSEGMEVRSLVPSGGPSSSPTLVTVTGSGFVSQHDGGLACVFGSQEAVAVVQSDTQLSCMAPPSKSLGLVNFAVLNHVGGKSVGSVAATFRYFDPVVVTACAPASGATNSTVTVQGMAFPLNADILCLFGAATTASRIVDENSVECSVPSGLSGTVAVGLVVDGYVFAAEDVWFTVTSPVTISRVEPTGGAAAATHNVTVFGSGFLFGDTVKCIFGDDVSSAVILSTSSVACTVQPHTAGEVAVRVLSNGVKSQSESAFTFIDGLSILSLSPPSGSLAGGSTLTVTGSGFLELTDLYCPLGNTTAPATILSDSHLTCVVPPAGRAGSVPFRLVHSGIAVSGGSIYFSYSPEILVSHHSPDHGHASGSTEVVVRGESFERHRDIECVFGDLRVPAMVLNSSALQCLSPPGEAGRTVLLDVAVNGQTVSAGQMQFSYVSVLQLQSVSPQFGSTGGGSNVTVTGAGFDAGIALFCQFGDTDASRARFVDDHSVVCVTPKHARGSVSLSFATTSDRHTVSNALQFTFKDRPVVTSVSPNSVTVSGNQTVVVLGEGFDTDVAMECVFGNQAVVATVVSETEVVCVTPVVPETSTVEFTVSVNGQQCSGGQFFRFVEAIHVTGSTPQRASAAGGRTVAVYGHGFTSSVTTLCLFGSQLQSPANVLNSTTLQCLSPVSPTAGTVRLSVVVEGQVSEESVAFAFEPTVSVLSVAPLQASVRGETNITVSGSGFAPHMEFKCVFGHVESLAYFESESTVVCVCPAHAPETVSFGLVVNDLQLLSLPQNASSFTFHRECRVESVAPLSGFIDQSTRVTVFGSGFEEQSGLQIFCQFGSEISSAIVSSDSTLSCLVPSSASTGLVDFSVLAGEGMLCAGGAHFRHLVPVTLTGVSPSTGSENGITEVIVSGSNFEPFQDIECVFGGLRVPAVVLNSSALQCLSPPGEAGRTVLLDVAVDGLAVSAGQMQFSYVSVLQLQSVSPQFGSTGGGSNVTVTGAGFDAGIALFCYFENEKSLATVVSDSELWCLSSPHHTGSAVVRVGSDSGHVMSKENDKFTITYGAFPTVTAIFPDSTQQLMPGQKLSVVGWGFESLPSSSLKCQFNDILVEASVVSDTELSCLLPKDTIAGAAITVALTAANDIFLTATYTVFVGHPTAAHIHPTYAAVGHSTVVKVHGHFQSNLSYSCLVGGVSSTALVLSDWELECAISAVVSPTVSRLSVLEQHLGTLFSFSFEFVNSPVISSVRLDRQNDLGSSGVQLSGITDLNVALQWVCRFDGLLYRAVPVDGDTVLCNIPSVAIRSSRKEALLRLESRDGILTSNAVSVNLAVLLNSVAGDEDVVGNCQLLSAGQTYHNSDSPSFAVNCSTSKSTEMSNDQKVSIDYRAWRRKFSGRPPRKAAIEKPLDFSSVPFLHDFEFSDVSLAGKYVAPSLLSSSCSINSQTSCFAVTDALYWNGSSLLRTERAAGRLNVSTSFAGKQTPSHGVSPLFLVLDSIFPSVVSSANGSWVAVSGKVFSNGTSCLLNNNTQLISVFVSRNLMECFVPALHISGSILAEITLVDFTGLPSANSLSVVYDFFESRFQTFAAASRIAGGNGSALERSDSHIRSDVCLSESGCESQILTAVPYDNCHFSSSNSTQSWMSFLDADQFGTANMSFCSNHYTSNSGMARRSAVLDSFNTSLPSVVISTAVDIVQVYAMYPESLSIRLHQQQPLDLQFLGTGFSHRSKVCLMLADRKHQCLVQSSDSVLCSVSGVAPGKNLVELLLDCATSVFTSELVVELSSEERATQQLGVSSWDDAPSINDISPLTGAVSGGTTIRLAGHHLAAVSSCSFTAMDGSVQYSAVIVKGVATALECEVPPSSSAEKTAVGVVLTHGSRLQSGFYFGYFEVPEVLYAAADRVFNHTVTVSGSKFPVGVETFCRMTYSDGTTQLSTGAAVSSTQVVCKAALRTHFSSRVLSAVAVSFNGVDFSVPLEIAALPSRDANIADVSGSSTTNMWLSVKQQAETVDPGSSAVIDDSTPNVVSLTCDSDARVMVFMREAILQTHNYSCTVNGAEDLGRASFVSPTQVSCLLSSRPPGIYELSVSQQTEFSVPVLVTINCILRPKILFSTLAPMSMTLGTSELRFAGLNMDPSTLMVCAVDNMFVSAMVNSKREAACVFDSIVPGVHVVSLRYQGSTLIEHSVCLTRSAIQNGARLDRLSSLQLSSAECDSKLRADLYTSSGAKETVSTVRGILSFAPQSGLTFGNTAVEVLADGVSLNHAVTCRFGEVLVDGLVVERNRVVCFTPSHSPGNTSLSLQSTTGQTWCCGWFYFHPLISLKSVSPSSVDSRGGSLITIETRTELPTDIRLYCHIDKDSVTVPAYRLSDYSLSCITPSITSTELDVAVGSLHEVWSDSASLSVSGVMSKSNVLPKRGSVHGGTAVLVSVVMPVIFSTMKAPVCLFGSVTAAATRVVTTGQLLCVTPPGVVGKVDVSVSDSHFPDSSVYLVGDFTFETPADIASISPTTVNQGEALDVLVLGSHFVDSPALSCLLNGALLVNARWLSPNMIYCTVPGESSLSGADILMQVSNNGHDASARWVFLNVTAISAVVSVNPTVGFTTGGTEVTVVFREPFTDHVACLFGSVISSAAYQIDSNTFVCVSPAFLYGDVDLHIVDRESHHVLHTSLFSFVSVPLLSTPGQLSRVLAGVKSQFSLTGAFNDQLSVRTRSLDGSVSLLDDCTVSAGSMLSCSVVAETAEEFLFLDLSVNRVDYIEGFAVLQVFQPSVVVHISALYLSAAGGNTVRFEVDQFRAGVATVCVFSFDDRRLEATVTLTSNTTASCISPALPLKAPTYLSITQDEAVIYGPAKVSVAEEVVVGAFSPRSVIGGMLSVVQIHFVDALYGHPRRECVFQDSAYELKLINSTLAICTVMPTLSGEFPLLIRFAGVVGAEGDVHVGTLQVSNAPRHWEISSRDVLGFASTNISVTSPDCDIPSGVYCHIPGTYVATTSVSSCELRCTVEPKHNLATMRLDVCSSSSCAAPLFSTVLHALHSVSVVAVHPESGPVQGSTRVNLYGSGFSNDATLQCQFGSLSVPASVVSSSVVQCFSPPLAPGVYTVDILSQGKVISRSTASFESIPLLSAIAVHPAAISSLGGSQILVTTQKLHSLGPYDCRFNEKYTPALVLNATTLQCIAPSFDVPDTVEFALALDRSDISATQPLSVVQSPSVVLVDPSTITANVPFNITVILGLHTSENESRVYCWMDGTELLSIQRGDELVCVLPTGLAAGIHSLALHQDSVQFFSFPISATSRFGILSVAPLSSLAATSVLVTVWVTQQDTAYDYSKCCFGALTTTAVLASHSTWQCYSPVVALGGNSSLVLPVGLARSDAHCEYSGFDFSFVRTPVVKSVSGTEGSTAGGTAVVVEFFDSLEIPTLYCRLGLSVFLGQVVDPHRLLCVTPDPPAATNSLEFSLDGVDFFPTGFDFSYVAVAPDLTVPVAESVKPIVYFIAPNAVSTGTQSKVQVLGTGFRPGAVCLLGAAPNSLRLVTSFVSEGEVSCVMPVHAPGEDLIFVANLDSTTSDSPAAITFVTNPSVSDDGDTAISPLSGPTSAQTLITVSGYNLDSIPGPLFCVIGDDFTYAIEVTATSAKCVAPTSLFPKTVTVRLANANKELLSGSGEFTYIRDATVSDANPKRGSFNTTVNIAGTGFLSYTNLTCMIGDLAVDTVVVSDTLVQCNVPTMETGTYSVTLETNGQHLLRSGSTFEYFELATLTELWPTNGPSMKGNTVVSVYGSDFTDTVDILCVFDTTKVPAVFKSPEMVQCVTPPHKPGLVNVSVIADGTLVHPIGGNLFFLYAPDVSVDKITPEFGYTSGEFPVFVFGSNFMNTTGLQCKFADMISRGIFLSNTSMVCLAPSPLGRPELYNRQAVDVEVSVNGIDFSTSGVQFAYSQPCDQGFFCPGMTRQLCPNGTFCPENSRNFTLCEPGTFQPKEGQTGCALCPIGYICPDHGMPRPVNCPPGLICDVMGLRTSAKLCPSGQYCLNNTKASDVTFLDTSKGVWFSDPVTGVVSFNVSSYDWSYTTWPAPAVGQSRTQHPPEPSCDGQVCFPGSSAVLAEAPFPCPIGHYCRAGAGTAIPMPKNFSSPQRCFDGFFCPRGSSHPEGSGPCPNGYFCPTQQDAILCPQGHYCPGVGNSYPIECYPGTYNPFEGRANCTVCPTGYICPGWGVLLPEPCPAGFVCMALGVSFPVVLCPQGFICGEGTLTLDPSAPTKLKPRVCEAGKFCLGGVSSPLTVNWIPETPFGVTHPQSCSEGTYCEAGAYLSSGSGLCFRGHYCPPDSSFPIETPVGNFASGLGSVAPTLCYPGTYAPLDAQVDCLVCPSGNTCTSYGTYIPSVCAAGTYRSQVDSVTCTQCPTGTYSYEVGSPDLTLCLPCPQGRICGVKQMVNLNYSTECPAGYICGYGTDRSSQFKHLTPAGFHTPTESTPFVQYDSVCQPGYYCPRGTPSYLQFGGKCPVGYYCPQSTPAAISADVKCPVLTTSLSSLDTVQGCRISEINVCDKAVLDPTKPMEDSTYYPVFDYTLMDDTDTKISFDSSLSAVTPTGEIQVVRKIYPTNISASSEFWQNDTIEAFRSCPLYGSGVGGDNIIVIGRNFRDSKLNYCKFRACISANDGRHPRRCRNQLKDKNQQDLSKAGVVSDATFITRARYISPTRMECPTPEFIFDKVIHPDNATVNYQCMFVNNFGVSGGFSGEGNYSYVRRCGTTALSCMDQPFKGFEYFASLTLPCSPDELLDVSEPRICSDMPEPGYMFNPCMSAEVIVEVTNDGEHYSGGEELDGISILSTVRYNDDNTIYNNFKSFTVNSTFAVYTYVYPEYFYNSDPGIMAMERSFCELPRYAEEAEREREMGWFQLPLQSVAHVHVDFSFLPDDLIYNEHYALAIFMLPSRCTVEICSPARVRLSPEEFLSCRKPAKLSYWFENSGKYNVKNNITIYALDDLIFKVEIHLLYGLFAAYEPLFQNTSIVRIASPSRTTTFTGSTFKNTKTRRLSQYISFEERLVPETYFWCAVVYFSDTLTISQALNMPPTYAAYERGRALIMNNVSAENVDVPLVLDVYADVQFGPSFWLMPASTSDNSKELLDAYFETFHDTTYDPTTGYVFNFQTLLIGYLPYFSNCNTFDSYIPIWLLLEGKECELPDIYPKWWHRYNYPALPDQDDIKFVGPFDFLEFPVADWCERKLTCHYEEILGTPDSTPRWFEVGTSSALFQMIRFPMNYDQYTGRKGTHISTDDAGGGAAVSAYAEDSGDNFIAVSVDHAIGDLIPGCILLCYARSYLLTISYYQLDLHTKKIILISLAGDEYDFNSEDTSYELGISYQAMGFIDLVLNFAFPLPVFVVMFIVLGFATAFISFIGWGFCRMTTLLQNPPQLKMFGMIALVVPPPLAGVTMAVIPIWILTSLGNYFINGQFFTDPNSPVVDPAGLTLDTYNLDYANLGTVISTTEFNNARAGRIGSVFVLVAFCCFVAASKMYFPKEESKREREIAKKRTDLAHKRELWDPVLWKKANFMFSSVVFSLLLVLVVEFSFWSEFGSEAFYSILVMFIIFGEVLVKIVEYQLQDIILVAPLNAGYAFATQLVTFGSPDFLAFLLSYFLGFAMSGFQRVFQGFYLDAIFGACQYVFNSGVEIAKRFVPKYISPKEPEKESEKDFRKREVEGVAETGEDAESVEPIIEYFAGICSDTMILFYFPFFVYLLMQYREQIQIPIIYGIRQSDMMIYLVFQLLMLFAQPVADIFNHAQCELFHGWKIYEYLVYSRYRFLQRETRWKGMENSLDECIEESLRKLDQMCFSSQYYIMLTAQVNGIIYMIIAFECWLRVDYSPFSDSGFFILLVFMVAMYVLLEWAIVFLAVRFKLYKIKHENTAWHLVQKEEDELDIPGWEDIKGASSEAYVMNQRITSETFRYKFLNYNRTWLINQLPQLLTPRTMRRSRPYLINQFARIINAKREDISDDSDKDAKDKKFGPVALTAPSRNIIRWWLGKARRRLRLRNIVEPLIKRARGAQCEQCLSRKQLQIEYEVDVDKMAEMYDRTYPGDEEVDQVQWKSFWVNNQRYHTICLACLTKRKEVASRNALKGALDASMFDDEQEDYPDWGPVFLTAASKAMLLNWYRKAQRLRAGKRGRRANKVVKAISDDEGDELPLQWLKDLAAITPATNAIAVKWMRTARARLQKKAGKGVGLREVKEAEEAGAAGETFRSGNKSRVLKK